jgi:serine/threonine protein kinase
MKVQSRELISERLIGKGTSSIVYETTWEGRSYARKDFLGVPKDIFEEEAKALVDLDNDPFVVGAYCWTVDEESCSLVTELMEDDLHSLVQRRMAAERKKLNPGSGSSGASQATSHVIDLQQFMEDRKKASVATTSESVASPPIYPFSMPEALKIMWQIAYGMKFLHKKRSGTW